MMIQPGRDLLIVITIAGVEVSQPLKSTSFFSNEAEIFNLNYRSKQHLSVIQASKL